MIRLLIGESYACSCQLLLIFFAQLFNSCLAHISPGIAACAASIAALQDFDILARVQRKGSASAHALRARAGIVVIAACALRCGLLGDGGPGPFGKACRASGRGPETAGRAGALKGGRGARRRVGHGQRPFFGDGEIIGGCSRIGICEKAH